MAPSITDEFARYLAERSLNTSDLLSRLNSSGDRGGDKTLRDLWEMTDLSANDFADEVARFYRLPRRAPPPLPARPPPAPPPAGRSPPPFLRETLFSPYGPPDGGNRIAIADPNDMAAARAAEIVL